MIAQKIVDAKQSQIPRHAAITTPDVGAAAFGTPTSEHFSNHLSLKSFSARLAAERIQGRRRLFVFAPFSSVSMGV